MENQIVCPHCNQTISIDQALDHQYEAKFKQKFDQEREKIHQEAQKQFQESYAQQIELLNRQMAGKDEKLKKFQEEELKLLEQKQQLEEQKREFELAMARELDKQRQEIRLKTEKEILDQQHLKNLEKDKIINDLKKSLEDAQRKATQGSQQLQGEVLELDLESLLRSAFPRDIIEPVAKGVSGGDLLHTVQSDSGRTTCGVILWEIKRTKAWSNGWVDKLKADMRSAKANIPVIVSTVLPEEAKNGFGQKDGVWICSQPLVESVAMILRKILIDVAYQKASLTNKSSKSELIYDYITSHQFRQQIENIKEAHDEIIAQINKERMAFEKIWKLREGQAKRIISSTMGVYGSMQGLAGSNVMPELTGLTLELED